MSRKLRASIIIKYGTVIPLNSWGIMAQMFSPLRHRHSLLPEVVKEHFSDVAAFLYCTAWLWSLGVFYGELTWFRKIFGGDLHVEICFPFGLQELGLSEYLGFIFYFIFCVCLFVIPVLLFELVITIIAKLSPGTFSCLLCCFCID